MREGAKLYCTVIDRHAKSVWLKGLKLQRQHAQGPALLHSNYEACAGRKPNTRERKRK